MTPEELTKKQIDGYHNLLGYLGMCIISNSDVTVTDIKNRFKELNDKGLLPDSLKYLIEVTEIQADLLTQQQLS